MKKQKAEEFSNYVNEKLKDSNFKRRYEEEGEKLELALKVHALRKGMGWTQTELAKRMKTTQQAISRLERGIVSNCRLQTLMKLASATGTFLKLEFIGEKPRKAA